MRCPKCNSNLENDTVYCTDCGNRIAGFNQQTRTINVGRSADNDIVIANQNVSSHHAQFKLENGTITLEDLNSSNGTFVNGKKILLAKVTSNDNINLSRNYKFEWKEIEKFSQPINAGQEINKGPIKPAASDHLSTKKLISIGRTQENDIVINNIKVSRKHANLEQVDGEWFIEDLKSSNGTFVNGKKVERKKLSLSDTITVGGIPINLKALFEDKKKIIGDVQLSAKNLSFIVQNKTIVDDISVSVFPGEFVGLIGPAGAGKTTLMMMMNGVTKPSRGGVFINAQSLYQNINSFKGQIGYVPQDDIIHRELKVKESLNYTAKLRFNDKYSDTEIQSQVKNVIETLDLTEAKDVLIGTPEKKGISGGQRKKVNLGQELLTEPSILFLDEPTSGLDPNSDMNVMKLLKDISDKGKIVVLTTHNITVENFETLTHLIVLAKGGKLAYFGPTREACDYFGVQKPYQIFDTLNAKESNLWKEKYKNSGYYREYVLSRIDENIKTNSSISIEKTDSRNADFAQFLCLAERYLKVKMRDKVSSMILLFQAPIIALLIALVFNKAEEKMQALFVLVIAAIWLGCSNAAREIVSEQSIYKRERMVNLKIPSYIFSKIIILSALCFLQSLVLTLIVVPTLNMDVRIYELFALLFSTSVSSLSIGLYISSLVSTNEAAMGLIPIILIPQVILGGLISKFGAMNDFIKVLSGLMISRWAFEASLISEFSNRQDQVIEGIGFSSSNLIIDFLVIVLFNVVFLTLTWYSLKRKDSK